MSYTTEGYSILECQLASQTAKVAQLQSQLDQYVGKYNVLKAAHGANVSETDSDKGLGGDDGGADRNADSRSRSTDNRVKPLRSFTQPSTEERLEDAEAMLSHTSMQLSVATSELEMALSRLKDLERQVYELNSAKDIPLAATEDTVRGNQNTSVNQSPSASVHEIRDTPESQQCHDDHSVRERKPTGAGGEKYHPHTVTAIDHARDVSKPTEDTPIGEIKPKEHQDSNHTAAFPTAPRFVQPVDTIPSTPQPSTEPAQTVAKPVGEYHLPWDGPSESSAPLLSFDDFWAEIKKAYNTDELKGKSTSEWQGEGEKKKGGWAWDDWKPKAKTAKERFSGAWENWKPKPFASENKAASSIQWEREYKPPQVRESDDPGIGAELEDVQISSGLERRLTETEDLLSQTLESLAMTQFQLQAMEAKWKEAAGQCEAMKRRFEELEEKYPVLRGETFV